MTQHSGLCKCHAWSLEWNRLYYVGPDDSLARSADSDGCAATARRSLVLWEQVKAVRCNEGSKSLLNHYSQTPAVSSGIQCVWPLLSCIPCVLQRTALRRRSYQPVHLFLKRTKAVIAVLWQFIIYTVAVICSLLLQLPFIFACFKGPVCATWWYVSAFGGSFERNVFRGV